MEILIIILLIVLNGIFAMAEIAVITARKHRLQQKAQEGNKNAQAALELANAPNRFLSTVQIGITLIGVLAGAFGGATIAEQLSKQLSLIPSLDPYSDALGLGIVVLAITYLSLVIGELVPKRIALSNPESIALMLARPMNAVSSVTAPLVYILSISTDWLLHILQVKPVKEPSVSGEEIRLLIREGARVGIFEITESDIVERTLALGDRKVNSLMIHRKKIVWLEVDSPFKTIRSKIARKPYSHYPVCRDTLDKILGVIRTEDLLTNYLVEEKFDLRKALQKPLFAPSNMGAFKLLELFKKSGIHTALVVDEYGSILGLVSLTNVLEAIVGDIPTINELEEQEITKRDDNSWLVDGLVPIDEFKQYFHIRKLPAEKTGAYHTIGGFVIYQLGKIPVSGDKFEWEHFRYEIADMDGNRVDKLLLRFLISSLPPLSCF